MPFGVAFLRRAGRTARLDAGVDEVRGDLRAHDAGAEHGGAAHKKFVEHSCNPLLITWYRRGGQRRRNGSVRARRARDGRLRNTRTAA